MTRMVRMARWLALYPNSASLTGTRERAAKPLGAEERSFPRPLARVLALLAQMGELARNCSQAKETWGRG